MKTLPIITAALCAATLATASAAPVSAEALFTKANAEQHAGNTGAAILGYERAALLAPRDSAIQQNLAATRENAGLSVPAIPSWQRPAHVLRFDGLAILGSAAALICGLLLTGNGMLPPPYRGPVRVVSAVCIATALFAGSALALRWSELDRAVVLASEPEAHVAPAASSAIVSLLTPGEIVQAHETHGDYVRITTPDGLTGWVATTTIEPIIPAARS